MALYKNQYVDPTEFCPEPVNSHLNPPSMVHGVLIVKTVREVELGISETYLPEGTSGYVLGHRKSDNTIMIYCPKVPGISGKMSGVIPFDAVKPIGRRKKVD